MIKSLVNNKTLIQYALILENSESLFQDTKLSIRFQGRYAVITQDEKGKLQSVYMGEGKSLNYKTLKIQSVNNKSGAAYIDFNNAKPIINAPTDFNITLPKG